MSSNKCLEKTTTLNEIHAFQPTSYVLELWVKKFSNFAVKITRCLDGEEVEARELFSAAFLIGACLNFKVILLSKFLNSTSHVHYRVQVLFEIHFLSAEIRKPLLFKFSLFEASQAYLKFWRSAIMDPFSTDFD